ncbi:NADPH-dependent methylglyoxal reductase [Yamadazyma tenuis]|uniref:NAD(P)-binding protein n=1 Tax=Candida tenuis (strain ATCC 10573 / BCRC 21748 / CBS 615 / JCM 9827 / NBRC 10315 / NRRL Y-1498 / VKM Y-70) TaxID=590646 RepID=G3BD41_CANTC|nr:NAD(P)-binding protein [Yamadazyma tenuis ATCC 10573]XP_006690515.1 uncharacterized protein CANTEDRAFT_116958 [Yamadazyma tenuis ATCC 10573]EGV61300.1 NAD(P)-binding protein [Yamadazyma tenuis ATCC 10573]EGV61301.1 hypothetical protein CANTEDRAFT_116958 [Yamadazyma tenuis ATCC 10573]WEJ93817.1 NADPH-dependent methylglyoxal reductase [Yamadazyma tenuis]
MSKVFITGVNGYIAQHLLAQLLEKGYSVVGTVRSEEKGQELKKSFPPLEYEVVPDIAEPGAFDKALQKHHDIVGFFHNASPLILESDDIENVIIVPAIAGTLNALEAVKKYAPLVKRFVFTSSNAAIVSPTDGKDSVVTEESWCNLGRNDGATGLMGYKISKTFAERAVWDFVEKEKPNFTFNVVHPTFVFGPQAVASNAKLPLNHSANFVGKLIKLNSDDPLPPSAGAFIDVRDVAKAHIFAFETELTKLRLYMYDVKFNTQRLVDIIRANFPQLSYLPKGDASKVAEYGNLPQIQNEKTRSLVGPFISLKQSVIDTIQQLIDQHPEYVAS